MALSESFLEPLVADDQKTSLASLSPYLHLFRHLEGSLAWDLSLLFRHQGHRGPPAGVLLWRSGIRHLKGDVGGVLLCSSLRQAFGGPASLLFSF